MIGAEGHPPDDQAARGILVVDGVWCNSCLLSLQSSIQKLLPTGSATFCHGSNLLEFSSSVSPTTLEAVKTHIQHLGYQVFCKDQNEAYTLAAEQRGIDEARQLTMVGFFATWVGILAWVGYISDGGLSHTEEWVLHIAMLFAFIPIAANSFPVLVESCWRAIKLRRWHIDMIILGGLVCSVALAIKGMIQQSKQTFFLDSTSMSLFLVFAARSLGSRRRSEYTRIIIGQEKVFSFALSRSHERILERTMGYFVFFSLLLSCYLLLAQSPVFSAELLFSLILIWPLAACPCLLAACAEFNSGLGMKPKEARLAFFVNAIFIAIFNITNIFRAIYQQLDPKILSISMLVLILALAFVNASLILWGAMSESQ